MRSGTRLSAAALVASLLGALLCYAPPILAQAAFDVAAQVATLTKLRLGQPVTTDELIQLQAARDEILALAGGETGPLPNYLIG